MLSYSLLYKTVTLRKKYKLMPPTVAHTEQTIYVWCKSDGKTFYYPHSGKENQVKPTVSEIQRREWTPYRDPTAICNLTCDETGDAVYIWDKQVDIDTIQWYDNEAIHKWIKTLDPYPYSKNMKTIKDPSNQTPIAKSKITSSGYAWGFRRIRSWCISPIEQNSVREQLKTNLINNNICQQKDIDSFMKVLNLTRIGLTMLNHPEFNCTCTLMNLPPHWERKKSDWQALIPKIMRWAVLPKARGNLYTASHWKNSLRYYVRGIQRYMVPAIALLSDNSKQDTAGKRSWELSVVKDPITKIDRVKIRL